PPRRRGRKVTSPPGRSRSRWRAPGRRRARPGRSWRRPREWRDLRPLPRTTRAWSSRWRGSSPDQLQGPAVPRSHRDQRDRPGPVVVDLELDPEVVGWQTRLHRVTPLDDEHAVARHVEHLEVLELVEAPQAIDVDVD